MAVTASGQTRSRLALGEELLPGAAVALRQHVDGSGLGDEISPNVMKALSSDGRLLESELTAALGTLVLLAHESAGGKVHEEAYPALVAMECLLAAGDVLDDIQDGDLDLKGWESPAIAAETVAALLVLAHSALASEIVSRPNATGAARALLRLTRLEAEALRGQGLDVRTRQSKNTHADALAITRAKSGALGRCAAEMGAFMATCDERMVALHGDFGEHIAVIFQLMNDIVGIWPSQPNASNLASQRPTPLLEFLANSDTGDDGAGGNGILTLLDAGFRRQQRESIVRSGAVQFTWALASAEIAKSRRKLHQIETLMPGSRLSLLLQR